MHLTKSSAMSVVGKKTHVAIAIGVAAFVAWTGRLQAGMIYVPNGSFESPETTFVDIRVDSWEKTPPIADVNGYLTGIFLNSSPTNADYIDNCDGKQAAYLFAAPGVELSQDYDSMDWAGATHQFDARFGVGKSYNLTVGVIGGGGGMSNGVTMQISLYYRDAASNKVVLAATTVTNDPAVFSNTTHFVDFSVRLPAVKSGDAWAGQHIGIQLLATASSSGYWDVDNVRLTESIDVPNGSFESPETTFVDIRIDSWQKTPPISDPNAFATGIFLNSSPTNADHIDNCDGKQAAYIFAAPGVELSQDFDSTDWAGRTNQFEARFEAGKSYELKVGVIGGGGGMSNGVTMQINFYYRDGAGNKVILAATTMTNSLTVFSNTTHFVDFAAHLPAVKPGDAWAGQHIGIQLLSVDFSSGYWDVDNVRLIAVREPLLSNPVRSNGEIQFTLESEPGLKFEILATTSISQPRSNWVNLGSLTNLTGSTRFTDAATGFNQRFYQAHQLP